jgi:hypothetical protein
MFAPYERRDRRQLANNITSAPQTTALPLSIMTDPWGPWVLSLSSAVSKIKDDAGNLG